VGRTHSITKYVAYLLLLVAIAGGVTWYVLRRGAASSPIARPATTTAVVDESWLSDLYSQNPRDTAKGTAKVNELGVRVLPQIQATLRDPASAHSHRRAALRAAGILGVAAEPALPEVAASLTDPELSADAAAALSFMGPKAFAPLRQAVNHPEVIVRRESLRSIGKLRFRAPLASADVLPLLLDAMPDTDPTVRTVAATYLGILHDDAPSSVPLLTAALEDPDPAVRRASATALQAFGSDAAPALPALKKAAADQDQDLAREAGRAIVAISGK
jgi:HEAT repeat protein